MGVLILSFPLQGVLVLIIVNSRLAGVQVTDQRVRLTTEVLSGIRLIKPFAWETFYVHQIADLRTKEAAKLRRVAYVVH